MGEKVEDVIQHFVSAYYDPVKAHDYYMRTRQLTGRKPSITKGMTKEQKQIFAVSKSNIGVAKKAEVVSNRSAEVARLNALRQTAKEAQDKIKAQMTALFASFQGDKVKTAVAKKDAAAKKLQIAGALKTILAQARASYKQQTSDVKSKYEQITTTEAQNILKGV